MKGWFFTCTRASTRFKSEERKFKAANANLPSNIHFSTFLKRTSFCLDFLEKNRKQKKYSGSKLINDFMHQPPSLSTLFFNDFDFVSHYHSHLIVDLANHNKVVKTEIKKVVFNWWNLNPILRRKWVLQKKNNTVHIIQNHVSYGFHCYICVYLSYS